MLEQLLNSISLEEIIETKDRSWSFPLLKELRNSIDPTEDALEKLTKALIALEDYRLIEPLLEIVLDGSLAAKVREAASLTLCAYCTVETAEERAKWWQDGDETIKRHAMRMAKKEEAELVVAIAKDPLDPLFCEALKKLGEWTEPHFQELLIQALDQVQPKFRAIAAKALIWEQPVRAEKRLLEIAMEADKEAAKAALQTLCYCVSNELLLKLAELTEKPPYKCLKAEYENAFGWVAKEFNFFLHDHYWESEAARQYFENWCRPAKQLLEVRSISRKREQSASAQSTSKENDCPSAEANTPEKNNYELDVDKIIADLSDESGKWREKGERYFNIDGFTEFKEHDQDRLLKFLAESPDPGVRELAVETCKVLKNSEHIQALLKDKCHRVRRRSICQCKYLERNEQIALILLSIIIDQNTESSMAIETLESYFVHASIIGQADWLLGLALYDKRPEVRRVAVNRLRELDAKEHSKKLLAILTEPPCNTWYLHIAVIENCLYFNIEIPFSYLEPLMTIDNPSLQEAVAKALFRPT